MRGGDPVPAPPAVADGVNVAALRTLSAEAFAHLARRQHVRTLLVQDDGARRTLDHLQVQAQADVDLLLQELVAQTNPEG